MCQFLLRAPFAAMKRFKSFYKISVNSFLECIFKQISLFVFNQFQRFVHMYQSISFDCIIYEFKCGNQS